MLLSCATDDYLRAHVGLISPRSSTLYAHSLRRLLQFLGDRSVESITLDDLRAFRAALFERTERYRDHPSRPPERGGLSVSSIHGHLRVVRQLFKWLTDEGHLPANPAARLELPELGDPPPKDLARADLGVLLAAAKRSRRDYALVLFLADTGARAGGASHVRVDDLDLARGRAGVCEKGKRGRVRGRTVYLKPQTVAALEDWLSERKKQVARRAKRWGRFDSRWLFLSRTGGRLTEGGIYECLERIADVAGVSDRYNPHAFRHGLARAMLENGCDLARVSQVLGHADVRVTAKFYGRFADEKLKKAHDQYSWIVGEPAT